jgi:site-specific recombinase XerD
MSPQSSLPAAVAPSGDNLPQWQAEFLIDRQAMLCTSATLTFYRYTLGHLVAFLADRGLALSPAAIRAFLVDCSGRGWADTTVHQHARAVKTFCRWLQAEGYTDSDLFARVPMPRIAHKVLPALTPDDVKHMLSAAPNDRDRAIILCLLDTGCRASELCALAVGDVNMKTGMVQIREGKGKKDRVTRLGAKSRKQLLRYLRSRIDARGPDPLFLAETGRVLNPNSLWLVLKRIGESAGVEHCGPHAFRRSFALWSYRQGMSLTDIQMLLGHSDLSVIRQYLDLDEVDMEAAHRRFGPVDNML